MKWMIITSVLFFSIHSSLAQGKNEKAVVKAVERLRKAMVDADSIVLDKLTSDKLSYGHSGGHIDDKKEFIEKIVSGKSDFVSIELIDQTVSISKKVALVRHKLNAVTNDNGKPGEVHLFVLMVWLRSMGKWKLLARQAVKSP